MPRLSATGTSTVAAAAALWLLGACQKPLDDAECRLLLDRYTELLVIEEQPKASAATIAHEKQEARALASQDPRFEFSECPKRVSRKNYDCAMSAPTVDAVERCLIF